MIHYPIVVLYNGFSTFGRDTTGSVDSDDGTNTWLEVWPLNWWE